jgi:lipopolysaccharide/colanic/teichoic acid biosynthesis glycosyltransferase
MIRAEPTTFLDRYVIEANKTRRFERGESFFRRNYPLFKRGFDAAAALGLIVMLLPVLALIALSVKLTSPGPIIYRQTRVGKKGKPFTFLKFRSMRQDADPRLHLEHMRRLIAGLNGGQDCAEAGDEAGAKSSGKLENDPRITPIGKLLRKTTLDELPQLLNILRGDMSLVGPRPPITYEVELYTDWQKKRLDVVPGATSLWVLAGRGDLPFDEQVRLDLEYIENRSFLLDLKILLKTPRAVLSGKGAG